MDAAVSCHIHIVMRVVKNALALKPLKLPRVVIDQIVRTDNALIPAKHNVR